MDNINKQTEQYVKNTHGVVFNLGLDNTSFILNAKDDKYSIYASFNCCCHSRIKYCLEIDKLDFKFLTSNLIHNLKSLFLTELEYITTVDREVLIKRKDYKNYKNFVEILQYTIKNYKEDK